MAMESELKVFTVWTSILLIAVRGQTFILPEFDYTIAASNYQYSWSEAETYCLNTYNRHLASIHSDSERNAAGSVCRYTECWIGGTEDRVWTDGSDWNYGNDQFAMSTNGEWKDDWDCAAVKGHSESGSLWNTGCDTPMYPLCGKYCSPRMTGFYYNSLNGDWERVHGVTVAGESVFRRKREIWGFTFYYYMWLETLNYGGSGWAIGTNYNANWWWAWKWGDDLFDYSDGERGWQYWSGSEHAWKLHSIQPVVSCSDVSGTVSITIFGDGQDGPGLNATDLGTNTIPYITDPSSNPLISILVGAAIGAVVLVAAVVVVLLKRNRRNAKCAGPKQHAAHHVAEMSPTENKEPVITALPAEKECADEVHVDGTEAVEVVSVETAAPKDIKDMSAEK